MLVGGVLVIMQAAVLNQLKLMEGFSRETIVEIITTVSAGGNKTMNKD